MKRVIDYRHFVAIAFSLFFLALGIIFFFPAFYRLGEAGRDFGLSLAYYFKTLAGFEEKAVPPVNELSDVITLPAFAFPTTFDGFKADWRAFFDRLVSKSNFFAYLDAVGALLLKVLIIASLVLPVIIMFVVLSKRLFFRANNDYDRDSVPLRVWRKFTRNIYSPVKSCVLGFVAFLRAHRFYVYIWLFTALLFFNGITILLEALAYFFYFAVSFDVLRLYRQVYKLVLDLSPLFRTVPWFLWAILALYLFCRFRKKIAFARLRHYEMRNRGFINSLPLVVMICGTMGKKKTTAMTDMALSQEAMLRDKAYELLLKNDMRFPYFPWIRLELELKRAIRYRQVYNLATVREWANKKAARFANSPCREKIFGYDYSLYGTEYNDSLKLLSVWDVICSYAQLYFVYIVQSSLIISNYSVRVDGLMDDAGNFPLWGSDFFSRDPRQADRQSRHAHILDFDSLRLGKKVLESGRFSDSFEFGCVLVTEIGKERGNNLENVEKRKKDETANQKNDLFNLWLKMVRHSATIDNFPFVKVFADEQRPESWGADARDLSSIVHIRDSGDHRLALPFFSLEEMFCEFISSRFERTYSEYRYLRGDNTLLMYLLKSIAGRLAHYRDRVHNRYGFCVLRIEVEDGSLNGDSALHKYYLMDKKIYSNRFSTDCFADFFAAKALRSSVGIEGFPEYATERATFAEMNAQHSYFFEDLKNGLGMEDKNK